MYHPVTEKIKLLLFWGFRFYITVILPLFLMILWNRKWPDLFFQQILLHNKKCYLQKNKRIITVLQQTLLYKYDQEKNHLNMTSSLLFFLLKTFQHFASCFFFHFKELGSVRSAVNMQNLPTPMILVYWIQFTCFRLKMFMILELNKM